MKHSDDRHDAFWLAEMLRLGILPEGYIYPRQERPMRDLLRKRGHLMRLRDVFGGEFAKHSESQSWAKGDGNDVKGCGKIGLHRCWGRVEDLAMASRISKETIDFLTHQIDQIERRIDKQVRLKGAYRFFRRCRGWVRSWR